MGLKLSGCSNSGFSMTKVRKKQILELHDWIDNNQDSEDKTYKEVQQCIINDTSNSLDDSKVRMLVPFLRKMKYIFDNNFEKRNSKISLKNFFTKEGLLFIELLKLEEEINKLDDSNINMEMEEINSFLEINSIINMVEHGEEIYKDVLNYIEKYDFMDKNEFFIMTTLIEENRTNELDEMIKKYRNGDYEGEIEIVKNPNAYGYIKPLFVECNLLKESDNKIRFNNDKIEFIKAIVNC